MEVSELIVVSFTLGRRAKFASLVRKCGVYATAKYLKARGYTLEQTLALVAVSK